MQRYKAHEIFEGDAELNSATSLVYRLRLALDLLQSEGLLFLNKANIL